MAPSARCRYLLCPLLSGASRCDPSAISLACSCPSPARHRPRLGNSHALGRKKLKTVQKSYFNRSQNLFEAFRRDLHLLCPSCLPRKHVNGHDLRRRAVPEQERGKQSRQFAGLQPETSQRPLLCSFSATASGTDCARHRSLPTNCAPELQTLNRGHKGLLSSDASI